MAERKPFLLRLDPDTMAALRAWAGDDLRSLNGQIEFLLRRALRDAGRAASHAKDSPGARRADDIDDSAEADAEPALAALSEGRGDG